MTMTDSLADEAMPLPIPGTVNFRAAAAGAAGVRPGVLFRSDALGRLGDEGRLALSELGIVRIVDLRSEEEVAEVADDVEGTGIEVVHVPIMAGSLRDSMAQLFAGGGLTLRSLYVAMLRDGGQAFGRVLSLLAEGGPTVIHCTAGKDRTGLAVALALLAIDVPMDVIAEDYARTADNLAGPWADAIAARLAQRDVALEGELRDIVLSSPPEALIGALDEVVLVGGSPDAYLESIGVDGAVRDRLRAALATSA